MRRRRRDERLLSGRRCHRLGGLRCEVRMGYSGCSLGGCVLAVGLCLGLQEGLFIERERVLGAFGSRRRRFRLSGGLHESGRGWGESGRGHLGDSVRFACGQTAHLGHRLRLRVGRQRHVDAGRGDNSRRPRGWCGCRCRLHGRRDRRRWEGRRRLLRRGRLRSGRWRLLEHRGWTLGRGP